MEQPPKKADPTSLKATAGQERVEHLAEMPEEWQVLREKILNNFENKTEGLDIERVAEFMFNNDLPITDIIIFEDEDILRLEDLFKKFPNLHISVKESLGSYVRELDLTLLRRRSDLESVNGSVLTEGFLVHEFAHGSGGYSQYIVPKEGDIFCPRAGFGFEKIPWGVFLEEAFADMMRGEYMEKNMTSEVKNKIKKANPLSESSDTVLGKFNGFEYEIPIKYLVSIPEGLDDYYLRALSVAATSLEMLCKKEPKLRQTMIEARSDIKKLREIPKLINAIKPGLYVEIQKCDPTINGFIKMQNTVKSAIENSK